MLTKPSEAAASAVRARWIRYLARRPAYRTFWTKSWLHHLGCTTVVALCFAFFGDLVRADAFHRLTGVQIRSQFTGKVLTDGTHWRETYGSGGRLLVEEMGQGTSTGSWRIDGDRLCKLRPGILNDCYEVWGAGDRVELRLGKSPPLEAFLRPAGTK